MTLLSYFVVLMLWVLSWRVQPRGRFSGPTGVMAIRTRLLYLLSVLRFIIKGALGILTTPGHKLTCASVSEWSEWWDVNGDGKPISFSAGRLLGATERACKVRGGRGIRVCVWLKRKHTTCMKLFGGHRQLSSPKWFSSGVACSRRDTVSNMASNLAQVPSKASVRIPTGNRVNMELHEWVMGGRGLLSNWPLNRK